MGLIFLDLTQYSIYITAGSEIRKVKRMPLLLGKLNNPVAREFSYKWNSLTNETNPG